MIKILGKTTSFNENKEIEKIVVPISTLQDDFKIQFPLTSISPLEDGEYRFKIGIRLEKECDDSVFYEVMINNSILCFKDKFFKLLTDDIAGSVSGANLEGDSFFNETKDLLLTDFFNSDDIGITLDLSQFENVFFGDESPDLSIPGQYTYTIILFPIEDAADIKDLAIVSGNERIKVPNNTSMIRFATDEFTFEEDQVKTISGCYELE